MGEKLRMLLVDDEPLLLRSIARLLRLHHEVEIADSGAAALARLEADDRFDVVFCDLMMPGMDGIDLYGKVRQQHPELAARMVFLTGGVFTDRVKGFVAQASPTLVEKPATLETLLEAAEGVAGRH